MPSAVVLRTALALCAGFAASALVVAATGVDPIAAYGALLQGAFGSADGLSEVVVKACPLVLCGLAIGVAFRAGIWNIGAEGQLLAGALAAAWIGPLTGGVFGLPLTLAAATAAGALWASIAGALKVGRNVNEVISTIMLNFVALALVGYAVQGPLMEAGGAYPQTEGLPFAIRLPRLVDTSRLHLGALLALGLAGGMAVLMRGTVFGFEIGVLGRNPRAARLAGIPVEMRLLSVMALSGALAGIAGGIEVCGVTYRLYERFSPGWGFTAIAVALLGRLDPLGILLAGIFFGVLEAGSNAMQRDAGVSAVLVFVIQATVILFLAATEWRRRPRAEAEDGAVP